MYRHIQHHIQKGNYKANMAKQQLVHINKVQKECTYRQQKNLTILKKENLGRKENDRFIISLSIRFLLLY